MSGPAYDPDAVAAAIVSVLTPLGVPVGTLGTVTNRTPDATPLSGPGSTPLVLVRPLQGLHTWITAQRKRDVGHIELLYRDVPLSQQKATTPSITQGGIEDAMWANRAAIMTALDTHRDLNGAIVALGPVGWTYNPDGVEVSWDSGMWVGINLVIEYTGALQLMTPTGS